MLIANDTLDNYRLISVVNTGKSGEVWAAENYARPQSQPVMLKVLTSRLFSQREFFNRADRWKSLHHRYLTSILETRIYQNQQIVVSEYRPQDLLANWLRQHDGRAPQEQAIDIISGILEGLSYLHQRQILHGELNPYNLQITAKGAQLLNWGHFNPQINQSVIITSLPIVDKFDNLFYAAPEVINNQPQIESDIWSTAVIFYQLLTGQLPFEGQYRPTVIRKITTEPLLQLPHPVAKPLSDIIVRALQRDPSRRLSAQEMLETLQHYRAGTTTPPPHPADTNAPANNSTASDSNNGNSQSPGAQSAAPSTPPIDANLQQAQEYFQQEKYPEALQYLEMALSSPQTLPQHRQQSLVLQADIYQLQQQFDQAIANYTQALEIAKQELLSSSPTAQAIHSQASESLAIIYQKRGNSYQDKNLFKEALEDYNNALKLDPKAAIVYNNRGNLYLNKGSVDLALADYNRAIELSPQLAISYYNRGNWRQQKGLLDEALADYNRALQWDNKFTGAYYNRGNLYLNKEFVDQALADYNKTIDLDPKNALAYHSRGIAYHQKGRLEQALADFGQALFFNAQLPIVYVDQARVYQKQEKFNEAIAACNRAISLDSRNLAAYQLRGDLYYAQRQLEAAIADYKQAIFIDPSKATTFIKRGNAYQHKGETAQAIEDYRQAIQLAPTNTAAYLARGTIYYQQKQFSLALTDYNQAIKQDSNCAAAYYNRGNTYAQQGQFDFAIADYNQALQRQPDSQTYNNRGNAYYDKGLVDSALNDYNEALKLDSNYTLAYYNRGIAYQTKGLLDLALADYNYILENLDATYAAAYFKRGDIYRERGNTTGNLDQVLLNKAVTDYTQALEYDPQNAEAYHARGLAYQALDQFESAMKDFTQAIRLAPQNAQFYHSRGNAYCYQGQLPAALTDYQQAITLDPQFAHAYYNRGLVYKQLDQKREAVLDFQKAKQLHQQPNLIAEATAQLRHLGVSS